MNARQPASTVAGLALSLALLASASATAAGWFQYRGPARDGRSAETGLARTWAEDGPVELWRTPIGAGFSAISVVGDRLYTMDSDAQQEYALCVDARTGQRIWRVAMGRLFEEANGNGPRSTPTIDGDRVFVLGSRGRLAALRAHSGEVIWQLELQTTFESQLPTWAFTTAPLVDGNRLLVELGGSGERAIGAFDKSNGQLLWSREQSGLAYSSPITIELGGLHQLVFLLKEKLLALDREGRELWSVPFAPKLDIKPAPPVFVAPDLIFVSASYDTGSKVVQLKAENGSVTAATLWEGRQMRNHFNASVAVDGLLYGFDTSTLRCIDARTGERRWAKRGLGKGSLIFADGMLIVLSERGKLVLVEATPDGYRELAADSVLKGRCWTQPSLWDGRLYLRNHSELVCLDLRRSGAAEEEE
jgi:outer membrane protein assembly factor BamB